MPQTILRNTLILLTLSLYIAVSLQNDNIQENQEQDNVDLSHLSDEEIKTLLRTKRGTNKVGFFRTLFSVIGEQYTETKDTLNKVGNLINDNFLPENEVVTEATTSTSSDPNVTTTQAPYKVKRSELNRIISRNIKGLTRLFNIELQDALRQSRVSKAEYDRNVSKEVSKFL